MLLKMKNSLRPLRVYGETIETMDFPYPGSSLHVSRKSQRDAKSKPEIRFELQFPHTIRYVDIFLTVLKVKPAYLYDLIQLNVVSFLVGIIYIKQMGYQTIVWCYKNHPGCNTWLVHFPFPFLGPVLN